MPIIGAALQHRVGDEPASLAVFSREIVGENAILLNSIRRYCRVCATGAHQSDTALTLLVVIRAFNEVVARTRTGSIY